MGQIIIELPNRINRHYRVSSREFADALIDALERAAAPVKNNPVKLTAEDAADIRAAKRARKGDLISWKEAEAYLDALD